MQEIKITSRNFELEPKVKNNILKKINKHKKLLTKATLVEIELMSIKPKGLNNITYEMEIGVKVPNDFIKVKETGKDLLSVIDKADGTLFRLIYDT